MSENNKDRSSPSFSLHIGGSNNNINIHQSNNTNTTTTSSKANKAKDGEEDEEDDWSNRRIEMEGDVLVLPHDFLPKAINEIDDTCARNRLAWKSYIPVLTTIMKPPDNAGPDVHRRYDQQAMKRMLQALHNKMTNIGRTAFNRQMVSNNRTLCINGRAPTTEQEVKCAIADAGRNCSDPLSFVKDFANNFYFTKRGNVFLTETLPSEINRYGKTCSPPFMIRPTKDKRSSHCFVNIANRGAVDARKQVVQALRSGFGISFVVRSTKPGKANEVAVVTKLHGEGHGNSTLVIDTDFYPQFVGMDGNFFTFDCLRQMFYHKDVSTHISALVSVARAKRMTKKDILRLVLQAFRSGIPQAAVSSSNDTDKLDDEIIDDVLREAELECEFSMDWMLQDGNDQPQTSGVHHQPVQDYQPQTSGFYQPPQMNSHWAMQNNFNYQPHQTSGVHHQPPPRGAMQNFYHQHQTSDVHHQPPQNYRKDTAANQGSPLPHRAMQNFNHQHQTLNVHHQPPQNYRKDAVKSPVSSIHDGKDVNAFEDFEDLIQRSGQSPPKEETKAASDNKELKPESYDPSTFGIVTKILAKKKMAKKWVYQVEWMPNPTTGESYEPEWQAELYLQKNFKDVLDQFNAREKEKIKSQKVLCAFLIFVIAPVTAHTILVVY